MAYNQRGIYRVIFMPFPNIDPTNFLFLQNLIALIFQIFPKLFWAILTLLFTRWLAKFGKYFVQKLLVHLEPTIQRFLIQAIVILIWIAGTIGALSAMGFDTTSLVAVIGAAGLAIGLALQNSLSHLAAGLLLISFRLFEVGDTIESGSISGNVESIGLFSTAVITGDNTRITIPNGNLFSGTLKNFSVLGTRRIDMKINIADRKIQPTIAQLMTIAQTHPSVLIDPSPTCIVTALRKDETIVALRPWCRADDYDRTRSDILQTVQEYLDHPPASVAQHPS
jgi:small conductance mechanosensitive channel